MSPVQNLVSKRKLLLFRKNMQYLKFFTVGHNMLFCLELVYMPKKIKFLCLAVLAPC